MATKRERYARRSPLTENVSAIMDTGREQATAALLVSLDKIDPDTTNSRPLLREFDWSDPRNLDESHPRYESLKAELEVIEELAKNIESTSQLQPVILRHKGERFQLVVGHRRFLACQLLGRSSIFATVPKNISTARAQFAENYHRRELDLQGKLEAVAKLLAEEGLPTSGPVEAKSEEYTKAVAALLDLGSMGERSAYRHIRVLYGPSALIEAIQSGVVQGLVQAEALAALPPEELESELVRIKTGAPAEDAASNMPEPPEPPKAAKKAPRGPKPRAVTIKTKNTSVIRHLVETVAGPDAFPYTDWSDYGSVQQALKEMLEQLEKKLEHDKS